MKLNEWNYKRTEHAKRNRQIPIPIPKVGTVTSLENLDSDVAETITTPIDFNSTGSGALQNSPEVELTTQQRETDLQSQEGLQSPSPPPVDHFQRILHRILEAPSACFHDDLLSKHEFSHGGSTFMHYVASKGRVSEVLEDIIRFTSRQDFPTCIDERDAEGYTAFHIAVKNDRRLNAQALSTCGASAWVRNNMGELPLQTYISTSQSGIWIQELLQYKSQGLHARVEPPSAQAGHNALDLIVSRVVAELSRSDASFCRPATKHILEEVLKGVPIVDDNSKRLLRGHAVKNPQLFSRVANVVNRLSRNHELLKVILSILRDRTIHDKRPMQDKAVQWR